MIDPLYISHLFLPIPFMLLYSLQTKKFNRFTNVVVLTPVAISLILYRLNISATSVGSTLQTCYALMFAIGTFIFRQKYDLPQAVSFAFNLAFFNSLYWEIPIHIYTPIYLGFFDQTYPLHVIYAFPAVFLYNKLRFPNPHKKTILLFLSGLIFSTIGLGLRVLYNPYIWGDFPPYIDWFSFANRFFCFGILLKIFYNTEPIYYIER